ncbi:MAG: hypothetical protein ACHP9S_08420 [Terriglobales bacterium]
MICAAAFTAASAASSRARACASSTRTMVSSGGWMQLRAAVHQE